jgi:hypothetical protein
MYKLSAQYSPDVIDRARVSAMAMESLKNDSGVTAEERRKVAEKVTRIHAVCNQIRSLQFRH